MELKIVSALMIFAAFFGLLHPVSAEALVGEALVFRPIGGGCYGGVTDRRFVAVKDLDEWRALWGEIYGNVLPLPPLPEVDFSRQTLAAVFQGLKRSGGYSIEVEAVKESADRVTVVVREWEPGPRNLVTMALSSPWEVVTFPVSAKPIIFTLAE